MTERRTKAWWQRTVARWRRSGKRAEEFAAGVGVPAGTLQWWSWRLGNDTRASHGPREVTAIEPAVPSESRSRSTLVEVAIGDAIVRCEAGTDAEYVASLPTESDNEPGHTARSTFSLGSSPPHSATGLSRVKRLGDQSESTTQWMSRFILMAAARSV